MMRKTQGYRLATFSNIFFLVTLFILDHVPVRTGSNQFLQFQDKEFRNDILTKM